jgi:uncharacterized protein (DUF305 family)
VSPDGESSRVSWALARETTVTYLVVRAGVLALAAACTACSGQPAAPAAVSVNDGVAAVASTSARAPVRAGIASAPASDRATENFEVKFMTGMIDHHMMAVMMADICLAKTLPHEELTALCADIKASQSAEIVQMQTWLQQWYGIAYEPAMKPGHHKMLDDLASLNGAEFEIAFMETMIKHHDKALTEGRHCLDKAEHEALREMCEEIIATQSAEILRMQTWLCDWYHECSKV